MKMTSILSAATAVMIIAGCAATLEEAESQALLPEIDIVQLKENSDEALKMAQEIKLQFQVINTRLTEIDNRLVVLSEEVSSVSLAKIEELENRLALLIEAYKDLQEQVAALEALPSVRRTGKVRKVTPTFAPGKASALLTSSEYDLYRQALGIFDSRDYAQAKKLFTKVIEKHPKGDYTANARYWIGECDYALSAYADAIVSFLKVLEMGSNSKSDDAQLKLGMSYLRMGKSTQAKEELNKLINRYPNSEYVARARKYLANIK